MKEKHATLYLTVFQNYMIGISGLYNEKKMLKAFEKLKEIQNDKVFFKNKSLGRFVFIGFQIELNMNLSKKQYQKNVNLIPLINEQIINLKAYKNKREIMLIYYLFTYSLFANQNYDECINWVNVIVNEETKNINIDMQITARFVLLLVHYELKNEQFLEYQIVNTSRYLNRIDALGEFESLFLSTLSKLIRTENQRTKVKDPISWNKDEFEGKTFYLKKF